MTDFLDFGRSGSYPYIFSTNEAFYVRWGYSAMATGSVMVIGQFSWAEVELP